MIALPDDATLAHDGLAAPSAGSVLVIACGALAREIIALREANGWSHLHLTCLPAILHNRPERIPDAVAEAITANRDRFDRIIVAYGDCGTGGELQSVCDRHDVLMLNAPHCYAVFDGPAFTDRNEIDAFYLTDFLVRQFDAFVWEPLGLSRHPALRDMYFGNYTRLIYLAQTDDTSLDTKARDCAARLGLAYDRRLTGYGDLGAWMAAG